MWFKFPTGSDRISIERQQFVVEAEDADGCQYFRAPDHFAPLILQNKGFGIATTVPEGAPDDLPKSDPLRDENIAMMSKQIAGLQAEVANLRTDYLSANARNAALLHEKAALATKLEEALKEIIVLKSEADKDGVSLNLTATEEDDLALLATASVPPKLAVVAGKGGHK